MSLAIGIAVAAAAAAWFGSRAMRSRVGGGPVVETAVAQTAVARQETVAAGTTAAVSSDPSSEGFTGPPPAVVVDGASAGWGRPSPSRWDDEFSRNAVGLVELVLAGGVPEFEWLPRNRELNPGDTTLSARSIGVLRTFHQRFAPCLAYLGSEETRLRLEVANERLARGGIAPSAPPTSEPPARTVALRARLGLPPIESRPNAHWIDLTGIGVDTVVSVVDGERFDVDVSRDPKLSAFRTLRAAACRSYLYGLVAIMASHGVLSGAEAASLGRLIERTVRSK